MEIFNKATALTCFLILFISPYAKSQEVSLFGKQLYIDKNKDTLRYRLLIPDYGEGMTFPLVIFLHGSGERGNDNEAQLKWGVKNFASHANLTQFPAIVIAPQLPKGESWANISGRYKEISMEPEPSLAMKLVIELINNTIEKLPVDKERVYITGLSMGGFGTFDAVSRHPELFAAAVPVCGGGDLSMAPKMANVPMWIFTSTDDSTVDPKLSIDMAEALRKAGANPGFTMYPEVGHFSWIAAYGDDMMMTWLFRQKNDN